MSNPPEIEKAEWQFKSVYESDDIDFVKAIHDWELTREAWRVNPDCLEWFFELRNEVKDDILEHYEKLGLRAGLWTISDEFPEKPALSIERFKINQKIKELHQIVPRSRPKAALVQMDMGKNFQSLLDGLLSCENVSYNDGADAYLWHDTCGNQKTDYLIFPVCVDLRMSTKAIVDSFRMLLELKKERLGYSLDPIEEKGRGAPLRKYKNDLKQLAAYRLREMYVHSSKTDWWLDAWEEAGKLYSEENQRPWNRAADDAKKAVQKRSEEILSLGRMDDLIQKNSKLEKMEKKMVQNRSNLE